MDRGMSKTHVSPWRAIDALQEESQPKCKTSKNHHGVSRWSIKPYPSALRIPYSYDIKIGCSSDLRTGCSYVIKTSIVDELRVMSRYEQLWAIAIFICCTFAVLKMKNEEWNTGRVNAWRLAPIPLRPCRYIVVILFSPPWGGVSGGLLYHE